MHSSKRFIKSLTSARFIAAVFILLMHYGAYIPYNKYTNFVLLNGGIGVCFFFMLSGFIITFNYYDWFEGGVDLKKYIEFIRARFARIYPMYVVALLFITPIILYFSWHNPQLLRTIYYTSITPYFLIFSWLANLLLVQVFIPYPPLQQIWNAPSWAVGCEVFFYITFPFIASYLAYRFSKGAKLISMCIKIALISMALLILALIIIWYQPVFSGSARLEIFSYAVVRMPLFRIPEFILGCLIGLFYIRSGESNPGRSMNYLKSKHNRNYIVIAGLLMIALIIGGHGLAYLIFGQDYAIQSLQGFIFEALLWYIAYMLPFSLLIIGLAFGDNFLSPLLEHPWAVLLGEASYSLYIIHWIPLTALNLFQYQKIGLSGDLTIMALLLSIIALSVLSYRYVETPARNALRGKRHHKTETIIMGDIKESVGTEKIV